MKNDSNEHKIPSGLDYMAGLSWRLLVILGVIAVLIFLVIYLKVLVIPFLVAILITAMLFPLVELLVKVGFKRALAVATSLVALFVVVGGLSFLVVQQVRSAYPDLRDRSKVIFDDTRRTLEGEPFNISDTDIDNYVEDIAAFAQNNSGALASGLVTFGSAATNVVTGFFLVIFAALFMLLDGKNIW